MALCWKLAAIFSGAFLVVLAGAPALLGPSSLLEGLCEPGAISNAAGTAVAAAVWLALRGSTRSILVIGLLDLAAGLLVLSGYALSFALAPLPAIVRPDLVMILITTAIITVRAIGIPASAWHTGSSSALAMLPAVVLAAYFHWKHPTAPGGATFARNLVLDLLWCATPVVIAGFASRVIYGLRAEVAQAKRLGQYVLEQKIGEGGMGMVYRAHHALLRRATAVKLLLPDRAGPDTLARFEREVQLTATLTHPNTVSIFDYGRTPEGVFYYAMEYLEGMDLQSLVSRSGPQAPARVIHVLHQVCGSLGEAHQRGLVHRDIKPANVILCERGGVPDVVKVVDFGLVKEIGKLQGLASTPALTRADTIIGTPLYMAPEALRGETADRRADLYALGAVGYFLLTGRPVFEAASVVEICAAHLNTTPVPPSTRLGAKLPEDLEALLLRCLAKDAGARPQSAAELSRALLACAVPRWTEEDARTWWARLDKGVPPGAAETQGDAPTVPA